MPEEFCLQSTNYSLRKIKQKICSLDIADWQLVTTLRKQPVLVQILVGHKTDAEDAAKAGSMVCVKVAAPVR